MISTFNATNMSARDAKLASDCGHVCVGLLQKLFDLVNLACRQFRAMSLISSRANNQSILPSMLHVFKMANPLKVFWAIVRFVSVFVINLRQVFRVFQKTHRNKTVRGNRFGLFRDSFAQFVTNVSIFAKSRFEQLRCFSKLPSAKGTGQDLPRGANLVKAFVAFNVFPGFGVHKSNLGPVLG